MTQSTAHLADKHRVFLFDFDGTLFDTAKLKIEISEKLKEYTNNPELLWETERKLRGRKFHLVETLHAFSQEIGLEHSQFSLQNILLYHNFTDLVFPETVESLKRLHHENILAIFTEGDEIYQQFKMHQSGLSQLVDFSYIYTKKQEHLAEIVNFFGERKVWYVDNQLYQLERAKKQSSTVTTVWINREQLAPKVEFQPDYTIKSLSEL